MKIYGIYSFAGGKEFIQKNYKKQLSEVEKVIELVDCEKCLTKVSDEKTMKGELLYSPVDLNKEFKVHFSTYDWENDIREHCEYPKEYYVNGYTPTNESNGAFRSMDFRKDKLGVEVQFGKYSFMVYNVCAKMTIFRNLNYITAGIEIVPVKTLAMKMSSGVSYFEQFVWDLEKRGVSNIDVPVLILGIGV